MRTIRFMVLIASLSSAPVLAASSASASLSDFTFTLTDLDSNDGVTPSVSWQYLIDYPNKVNGTLSNEIQVINSMFPTFAIQAEYIKNSDPSMFSPINGQATSSYGQINSAVSGIDFNSAKLIASGNTVGTGDSLNRQRYQSEAYAQAFFTLSANTRLDVKVKYDLFVNTSLGYDPSIDVLEYAYAYNNIFLGGSVIPGSFYSEFIEASDQRDILNNIYSGESFSQTGFLEASYSSGGFEVQDYFSANSIVRGFSQIATPVPEPENYAMLMAGLGVVGMIARRKKPLKLVV